MSQAPVMPVFTDALLGDTMHLTTEEFGAYCLLLFATWRNNGVALVDDDKRLCRITRVSPKRWARIRGGLEPFFDLSAGTWEQKRLRKEWNRVHEKLFSYRENGRRGAEARWLKYNDSDMTNANGDANAKANGNHNHNHNNPQTPFQRGLRKNGNDADPYRLAGLSSEALMHRFNAAAYGSTEREAIRKAMEQPP